MMPIFLNYPFCINQNIHKLNNNIYTVYPVLLFFLTNKVFFLSSLATPFCFSLIILKRYCILTSIDVIARLKRLILVIELPIWRCTCIRYLGGKASPLFYNDDARYFKQFLFCLYLYCNDKHYQKEIPLAEPGLH